MEQKIKLKVCGLRDNIEQVASLRPDFLGFIFYEKSPRFVGADFKMPAIEKEIKKVGVFVNEHVSVIADTVGKHGLDLVQLHRHESPADCSDLRSRGIGVVKAFAMEEGFDFDQLEPYESVVDYFLFDTKTPSYGGSGKSFNWKMLEDYSLDKRYFLSGGLSLENVGELKEVDLSKIHALDVNSRFEIEPGLKDLIKLKKLMIDLFNEKVNN
jgi:phosphoribosylanthranilate isomerase